MAELFISGLIVHFIADWILQSDWMSTNKIHLQHPAAWVHSGIHTAGLLLVFAPVTAVALGISHLLIDTRIPLKWLQRLLGQHPEGPRGQHFEIWQDQVVHIVFLYMAVVWQTQ